MVDLCQLCSQRPGKGAGEPAPAPTLKPTALPGDGPRVHRHQPSNGEAAGNDARSTSSAVPLRRWCELILCAISAGASAPARCERRRCDWPVVLQVRADSLHRGCNHRYVAKGCIARPSCVIPLRDKPYAVEAAPVSSDLRSPASLRLQVCSQGPVDRRGVPRPVRSARARAGAEARRKRAGGEPIARENRTPLCMGSRARRPSGRTSRLSPTAAGGPWLRGDVLMVTSERCEMRPCPQAGLHALGAYYRTPGPF